MNKIKGLIIFPIISVLATGCSINTNSTNSIKNVFSSNKSEEHTINLDSTSNLDIINSDISYEDLDKLIKVDYKENDSYDNTMLCIKTMKSYEDLVYVDYYDVNNDLELVYEYIHDNSNNTSTYTITNGMEIYRENNMKNIFNRDGSVKDSYTLEEVIDRYNESISEDNKRYIR